MIAISVTMKMTPRTRMMTKPRRQRMKSPRKKRKWPQMASQRKMMVMMMILGM